MAELTIDQALQNGIKAHQAGQLREAKQFYTKILKAKPLHPDANHNMGVLTANAGKVEEALLFFKKALEANPAMAQYWLSYINGLISFNRLADAQAVLNQAKSKGATGAAFERAEQRLQKAIDGLKELGRSRIGKEGKIKEPPEHQVGELISLIRHADFNLALERASSLVEQFPNSSVLYNICGAAQKGLGQLHASIKSYKKALSIDPNNADAYNNMGLTFRAQGRLGTAIKAYKRALSINENHAEAYCSIGLTRVDQGRIDEAIDAYKKALAIKPDFADALWNLSGTASTLRKSKQWLQLCLEVDPNHFNAKHTLSALQYYEGNASNFNNLIQSPLKNHPLVRSFAWVFGLPKLPPLFFHRWALFDRMIEQSKKDRPFYEFGVWRGVAFRYLIKTFKTGYGFDTFQGIPEDWHGEKSGSYSSEGKIPQIEGGEFVVGEFEETLPHFFSKPRPKASIINFDADLYSSTICALNCSQSIIDQHTILIFDEFITNKNWEEDEFKALNDFCTANAYSYEVLAISFFSKQVAVRLLGI